MPINQRLTRAGRLHTWMGAMKMSEMTPSPHRGEAVHPAPTRPVR
jgi:hypothetical protein